MQCGTICTILGYHDYEQRGPLSRGTEDEVLKTFGFWVGRTHGAYNDGAFYRAIAGMELFTSA